MKLNHNRDQLDRCEEMIQERQREIHDIVEEREVILMNAEEGLNDNQNAI